MQIEIRSIPKSSQPRCRKHIPSPYFRRTPFRVPSIRKQPQDSFLAFVLTSILLRAFEIFDDSAVWGEKKWSGVQNLIEVPARSWEKSIEFLFWRWCHISKCFHSCVHIACGWEAASQVPKGSTINDCRSAVVHAGNVKSGSLWFSILIIVMASQWTPDLVKHQLKNWDTIHIIVRAKSSVNCD